MGEEGTSLSLESTHHHVQFNTGSYFTLQCTRLSWWRFAIKDTFYPRDNNTVTTFNAFFLSNTTKLNCTKVVTLSYSDLFAVCAYIFIPFFVWCQIGGWVGGCSFSILIIIPFTQKCMHHTPRGNYD